MAKSTTMEATNSATAGRTPSTSSTDTSHQDPPSSNKKSITTTSSVSERLTRTMLLRTTFVLSLITAAVLCASLSYTVISNLEMDKGQQTYESVATAALQGARAITRRKLHGSHVMASILGFAFPTVDEWPFVSMDGFTEINKELARMSQSDEHGFIPLVDPDSVDVEEWQDFVQVNYEKRGFAEYVGVNDFGFGIWKLDESDEPQYEDERLPDTESNDYGGTSNFTVLAPLVEVGDKQANSTLNNLRSEPFQRAALDSIMECADYNNDSTVASRSDATEMDMPPCTVVTDMLELSHIQGPAGLIFTPVYPKEDSTMLVGMTVTVIAWKQVLENIVPDYVDGLICVISTPTQEYTFEIQEGVPTLLGDGDLHDTSYDHLAYSDVLDDIDTQATANTYYTLTVYPTDIMMKEFQTMAPLAAALGFVLAILLCCGIFFLYDFFMRDEVDKRQKIMEIKRNYVRFISHEIRTPLNTVCMGLELLEEELRLKKKTETTNSTSPTEPNVKALTDSNGNEEENPLHDITLDVQENAHTAVAVLNDILQYDKVESHTLSLEVDRVPILHLLERTVQQFQVQALNGKIDLKFNAESQEDLEAPSFQLSNVSVLGDELRLGQVLRNLISNALKFTPPKGTIEVKAEHVRKGLAHAVVPRDDNNGGDSSKAPRCGSIHIQVKDSGVGLTTDQLKQMFQEGIQFDANKLQHGGGSGLGLVIAKGIVEQHGGTIKVASEGEGMGTTFHLELPLVQVEPKREKTPAQTAPSDLKEAIRKRRVLVVDDVLSNRKMLVRLLERSGHTCETANNGEEAVEAIRQDLEKGDDDRIPFDSVLMDFEMPILNGPDATELIRKLGYHGIIMGVTGNVLQEDTDHFRSKGADEILAKPISMARLQESWAKLSAPVSIK